MSRVGIGTDGKVGSPQPPMFSLPFGELGIRPVPLRPLDLQDRRRASSLVRLLQSTERPARLSAVQALARERGLAILSGFPALHSDREVLVTAMLVRTAVVEPAPGEPRVLLNQQELLVDPAILHFRVDPSLIAAQNGQAASRRKSRAFQKVLG